MRNFRWMFTALAVAALFAGLLPGLTPNAAGGSEAGPPGQNPTDVVVVRLYFPDRDALNAIAAEYDVWEVHHDLGYAVLLLTPEEYEALQQQGYR
ncbi:MAG: hypothetical protein ACP5SI_13275, partial [Chloroflexia bacterium]